MDLTTNTQTLTQDLLDLKLYVFADRFQVPRLQRALNRSIISNLYSVDNTGVPFLNAIIYALNNLPPADPMLEIMCKSCEPSLGKASAIEATQDLPYEFLHRYMMRAA